MSASHTPSPGQTPTASVPPFMRRRQPANPLVKPKPKRPHSSARPLQQQGSTPKENGHAGIAKTQIAQGVPTQVQQSSAAAPPAQDEYVDYPVFTTKKELLEGYRHHIMRFLPNASATVASIDPADESQFLRPVKLHRRDPRTNATMQWREGGEEGVESGKDNQMDDKERERLDIQRAERRAEREANQAQMAPVTKNAALPKKNHFQKKTEQVFQVGDNAGKKKALQLRYEEALPWHIEDFDSKNVWAGTYESALSDCHIMLVPEGADAAGNATNFRMLPVEKWYKFTAKNLFKALSIDEAEARMRKKVKDPRWFMETQSAEARVKKEQLMTKSGGRKLFTRTGERGEKAMKSEGDDGERGDVAADVDDIDYNYDEAFADDEENPLFGGDDEEAKEAEEKIKREQREANVFAIKEEKDYDKEEEEEKLRAALEKKLSKHTRKALKKREKNYVYEDDSDGNPYSSEESESENTDEEKLKEEERKKAEEAQQQQQGKGKATDAPEKPPSAPSSVKGTGANTPKGKQPDIMRKGILKRPGSPNLSEASGSESSRKKVKKETINGAVGIKPPHGRAGDIRNGATSGSDGEGSDAGRKKLKVRLGAGNASRAGTPNGSRAPSPSRGDGAAAAPPLPKMPTAEEWRANIPADGISLADLLKKFPGLIKRQTEVLAVLKQISKYDKDTKKLFPKT